MTVSSFQRFKWYHYLSLAAVLIVILLLLSAKYSSLKNQYGIETADSNDVTHPIDIKILIKETLEVCKKTKDDHHAYCDEAVNSLERKLTYQDINAQRSMARSALGLLHLNFMQIVLGAVTFIFVGLAFWAAHRTADAAVRTAEAAESAERARAYLESKIIHIKKTGTEDLEPNKFELNISAVNYGKTPATDFSCEVEVFETRPARKEIFKFSKHGGIIGPGIENSKYIGKIPENKNIIEVPSGEVVIGINLSWQFHDIWSSRYNGSSYFWVHRNQRTGLLKLDFAHSTSLVEDIG